MNNSEMPDGFRPEDPTAPEKAKTERTGVTFTVKEGPHGELWMSVEEDLPGLSVTDAGDAFLGFDFRASVTLEEAKAFTKKMRQMIDTISFTKFVT